MTDDRKNFLEVPDNLGPPPSQQLLKDRLSVVFQLAYESVGQEPLAKAMRATWDTQSQEIQPYERRLSIDEKWRPLDCGWVELPGSILIENRTGMNRSLQPSAEELAEDAKKLLVLSAADLQYDPGILIRPGLFFFGEWTSLAGLGLRAAHGVVKACITIYPR